MNKEFIKESFVIVAQNFNPTIFNPIWLKRHNITDDESIDFKNTVFSEKVSQFATSDYHFLVLNDQIQFTLRKKENIENILEKSLIKIIELLKETPYRAIGINFHWQIYSDDDTNKSLSKMLFFNEKNDLMNNFTDDNCRFGAYLSKDIEDLRLKLQVLPIEVTLSNFKIQERLRFDFNFHYEIKNEETYKQIIEIIRKRNVLNSIALKMIEEVSI